jgi:hypothetical protein
LDSARQTETTVALVVEKALMLVYPTSEAARDFYRPDMEAFLDQLAETSAWPVGSDESARYLWCFGYRAIEQCKQGGVADPPSQVKCAAELLFPNENWNLEYLNTNWQKHALDRLAVMTGALGP